MTKLLSLYTLATTRSSIQLRRHLRIVEANVLGAPVRKDEYSCRSQLCPAQISDHCRSISLEKTFQSRDIGATHWPPDHTRAPCAFVARSNGCGARKAAIRNGRRVPSQSDFGELLKERLALAGFAFIDRNTTSPQVGLQGSKGSGSVGVPSHHSQTWSAESPGHSCWPDLFLHRADRYAYRSYYKETALHREPSKRIISNIGRRNLRQTRNCMLHQDLRGDGVCFQELLTISPRHLAGADCGSLMRKEYATVLPGTVGLPDTTVGRS